MELMAKETSPFVHGEITIHVRTRASMGDKMAMEKIEGRGAAQLRAGAVPKDVLGSMGRETMALFVDGWSGVTVGGMPAPYSYEALEAGFPASMADDFIPKLCAFVAETVDILKA